MFKSALAAMIISGTTLLLAAGAPQSAATAVIQDYAFKAPTLTVQTGTEVVWTNRDDDPHTVTADDKSFDSKGLGQGDVYRHTFTKPGVYSYHCSAHPFMKGVIVVTRVTSK
jgi:plastocyanin